jgi:hypothetical protein
VLLVDHHETEAMELHGFLQERVGADDDSHRADRQLPPHRPLLRSGQASDQQAGLDVERSEQLLERRVVLLGEQLGRRHERRLISVLHREHHPEQRDDGLARADVPHEQPVHSLGRRHVADELLQRQALIAGQRPGQPLAQAGGQVALDLELHPGAASFRDVAGAAEHELEVEQLVEREPAAPSLGVGDRGRMVDRAERIGKRRQLEALAKLGRENLGRQRDEVVEMPVHQPADHFVGEPLRRRVDRQHSAAIETVGALVVSLPEDDELPRHDLAPVIKPDRAHHEQRLPHRDRPIEKCLTGPHALDRAARVLEHRVEDPEAAAGGQDAFRGDLADRGQVAAHLEPRDRSDGR